MPAVEDCPCGTGTAFDACCARLHDGAKAATAEALMRSRYSAFATGDAAYLLRTWHASTRPARLELDDATTWTRLDILATTNGTMFHTSGSVSFAAHYRRGGKAGVQTETSRFVRETDQWFYVDGEG